MTIFTGPVRSGKSTALMQWVNNRHDFNGFICPDLNGKRMLYSLSDQVAHPFEVDEGCNQKTTQIGRFLFLESTFELARNLLLHGCTQPTGTFIIDEVGWMELKGGGFEPALSQFIHSIQASGQSSEVILVVRDSLLEEVIRYYNLMAVRILDVRTDPLSERMLHQKF